MNAERYARSGILIAFWVLCLAVEGVAVAIFLEMSWGTPAMVVVICSPYLFVALLAWFIRGNDAAMSGLLLAVLVIGAFGTLVRYVMLQNHFWLLAEIEAKKSRPVEHLPVELLWLGIELLGMV